MSQRATLRLAVFSPSVLLTVASELGYLDMVDVISLPVPASPDQFRMLREGEVDAGLTSPDNVLRFRYSSEHPLGEEQDIRILAALDRGLGLSLFGPREARSLDDLRGGRLGVDVAASGFAFAAYEMLRLRGWRHAKDYQVVELGSTPRRREALAEGRCDFTLLNAGVDLLAEQTGLRRLARLSTAIGPYLGTVLVCTGATCARTPTPLRTVTRGMRAAADALLSGRAGDQAAEVAERLLGLGHPWAQRFVETLLSADEGLVHDPRLQSRTDAGLRTVATLRERYAGPHRGDAGRPATAAAADGDLLTRISTDTELASAWPLGEEC